jgi:hypothetical protein
MAWLFVIYSVCTQTAELPLEEEPREQTRVESFLKRPPTEPVPETWGSVEHWRNAEIHTHAKHMALCEALLLYDTSTYADEAEFLARAEIHRHRTAMKNIRLWVFEGVPSGVNIPDVDPHPTPYAFYLKQWKKRFAQEGADKALKDVQYAVEKESGKK